MLITWSKLSITSRIPWDFVWQQPIFQLHLVLKNKRKVIGPWWMNKIFFIIRLSKNRPFSYTFTTVRIKTCCLFLDKELPTQFIAQFSDSVGKIQKHPLNLEKKSLDSSIVEWQIFPLSQIVACNHFLMILAPHTKGQLNSEWIYEVIISPKIPTKNYRDFCPGSLLEGRA